MTKRDAIPDIIVSRLPVYLQALEHLLEQEISTTNSNQLGKMLGISPAQIRKDLSQFGGFGKQGTGYNIPYLIDNLREILKVKSVWDIVLIGAGDLGHAIARYQGFTNRGYRIAAVFDIDPNVIGKKISGHVVRNTSEVTAYVKENHIYIAMLTVPAASAQQVAASLVDAGIKAILNYAPITLDLPDRVRVEYIDPVLQLQHMTYYLDK